VKFFFYPYNALFARVLHLPGPDSTDDFRVRTCFGLYELNVKNISSVPWPFFVCKDKVTCTFFCVGFRDSEGPTASVERHNYTLCFAN
jgi:hypothetical protein